MFSVVLKFSKNELDAATWGARVTLVRAVTVLALVKLPTSAVREALAKLTEKAATGRALNINSINTIVNARFSTFANIGMCLNIFPPM